jgi:transcriptional regulator with XRE-family HTH domain
VEIVIGLEFICKTYNTEYKEIAEFLEVKPQTINSWLRGKRKIPNNRAEQLSTFFNLPELLFGKELTEDDEQYIEMFYKNDQVIQILEEKRIFNKLNFQELNDLILSLYRKVQLEETDAEPLFRKLDLIKKLLYLMLNIGDQRHVSVLWDVIDLLEIDEKDEYLNDLRKLSYKKKYLGD